MQAELDYSCYLNGHVIAWASISCDTAVPPPGEYVCSQCWRTVVFDGESITVKLDHQDWVETWE